MLVIEVLPPDDSIDYLRVVLAAVSADHRQLPLMLRTDDDSVVPVGTSANARPAEQLPDLLASLSFDDSGSMVTPGLVLVAAGPDSVDDDVQRAGLVRIETVEGPSPANGFAALVSSWDDLADRLRAIPLRGEQRGGSTPDT